MLPRGDNRPAWFFSFSRGRGHRQQTLRCKVKCQSQERSGSLSSSFYAPNKYHYLTAVQWPIFMTCIGINIVTDNTTEDVTSWPLAPVTLTVYWPCSNDAYDATICAAWSKQIWKTDGNGELQFLSSWYIHTLTMYIWCMSLHFGLKQLFIFPILK